MKVFIWITLTLFSVSIFASEYKIKSIWKNKDAPVGKTYAAVVSIENELEEATDSIIIFGNKNGKVKKRAFHLGGWTFYESEGANNKAEDNFYNLKYEVQKGKLNISLTPRGSYGKSYKVSYVKYESTASKRFATTIVKKTIEENNSIRSLTKIKTLSQFKKRLDLIKWDYGFGGYYQDYILVVPTFDLQIEHDFYGTLKNKKLSSTVISKDGSDLISKNFMKGKTWFDDRETAVKLVEDEIREGQSNMNWDHNVGTYSSFTEKAEGLQSEVLKEAAKKFVKYEITNTTGFLCEDSAFTWETYTWVLVDGSTYTYSPTTECD